MSVAGRSADVAETGSAGAPEDARLAAIVDVVAEILTDSGYDGLQLRDVARRARVSLSTIYEYFPSRDELILAAIERWAEQNVYSQLPQVRLEEPLCDRLVHFFRALLAPWMRNPNMLAVRARAALLPTSESLWSQGLEAARPDVWFEGYDPQLRDDVSVILAYMTHGLLSALASGRVDAAEMLAIYERTVIRLTEGAELLDPSG
jgi:AcrR family transcriptional regulator